MIFILITYGGDEGIPVFGGWLRAAAAAVAVLIASAAAVGCSGSGSGDGADIVVTTPALGALVREVVGDAADVTVVMPNGADPHEFRPSAKDVAALRHADLVVENGLGLETGLDDVLDAIRDGGPPVFTASDHVPLRAMDDEDEHHAGDGHDHGDHDPHIWLDPAGMAAMVRALAPALSAHAGVDVADRAGEVAGRLEALDAHIARRIGAIPPARRRMVTGHESLGYFADRYGLEVIGVVVPSRSSQAEASAADLAALAEAVERTGAPVIYAESGSAEGVAASVANQAGARVVRLGTHTLPDDGSYFTMMTELAETIHDAQTR